MSDPRAPAGHGRATIFAEQLPLTQTRLLPITLAHLGVVATLPRHYGNPFDWLLMNQEIVEDLVIVGVDPAFDAYPIVRRW